MTVSIARQKWEANMIKFGTQNAIHLAATRDAMPIDPALSDCFYDAIHVFNQIRKYTGDPKWDKPIANAVHVYRDRFGVSANFVVSGYWLFTKGLLNHYFATGDEASKSAVLSFSHNASYAQDYVNPLWTANQNRSREVAYNLKAQLDAERVGNPHRARTDLMLNQALGHIQQWLAFGTTQTDGIEPVYVRPFMVGITVDALIEAHKAYADLRIVPAVRSILDWIWSECWVSTANAFRYTNIVAPDGSGSDNPTADLNQLIVNGYSWLATQLGDLSPAGRLYASQANAIFAGGVNGAYLGAGKQFNQNYRQSFDYVAARPEI